MRKLLYAIVFVTCLVMTFISGRSKDLDYEILFGVLAILSYMGLFRRDED